MSFEERAIAAYKKVGVRQERDAAIAACNLCGTNGLLDYRDADGTPKAVNCSHDYEQLKTIAKKRGFTLLIAEPSTISEDI